MKQKKVKYTWNTNLRANLPLLLHVLHPYPIHLRGKLHNKTYWGKISCCQLLNTYYSPDTKHFKYINYMLPRTSYSRYYHHFTKDPTKFDKLNHLLRRSRLGSESQICLTPHSTFFSINHIQIVKHVKWTIINYIDLNAGENIF